MRILTRIARLCASLTAVFLLGGLLGSVLVRWAPGFGADERQLDPRMGAQALAAIGEEHAADRDIVSFYVRYLGAMSRGDLGESRSLGVPVLGLLTARLPVTLRLAGYGLLAGWLTGLLAAAAAGLVRMPGAAAVASSIAVLSTSVPVALLAFGVLYWQLPVWWCIAATVFPRVYRYTRNAFAEQAAQVPVMAAAARGVSPVRVMARYIALPVFPRTIALGGVTVSLALGASVPVEVLADVPGIGQLVWKAASGRDLPVLVSLTMLVTGVTLTANALADLGIAWLERSTA